MTPTRRLALALVAAAAIVPGAASAATPLPAEDAALVQKAVAYLQGLSSAKGRFVQTDARGAVTEGDFYLQRPGKARFAYDPPSGLVMASDGSLVAILNSRLKTYEAYPLGATPLSLFLGKEIRLDKGVDVTRVVRLSDGFSVVARDGRKKAEGQIALTFANEPVSLLGWTITDARGQSTRVRLVDFKPAGPFDSKIFRLRDPRPSVRAR